MIRIGIIGADAEAHLNTVVLLTDNRYEISGTYASDNRESMVFARQYRLVSYSSLDALFKYTDAVSISGALPHTMDLAEKSLKALKHTYISHPRNLSPDDIRYLRKLAGESGVMLQLGFGYRNCPVSKVLQELHQPPVLVEINHHLVQGDDMNVRLQASLAQDMDFLMEILQANIRKVNVRTLSKTHDGQMDMIHFQLECDNICSVNAMIRMIPEGTEKLEFIFHFSDTIVRADIFRSVIETQYCKLDVTETRQLSAYNEKMVQKEEMTHFCNAISNVPEALRRVSEQFQASAIANEISEQIQNIQATVFVR